SIESEAGVSAGGCVTASELGKDAASDPARSGSANWASFSRLAKNSANSAANSRWRASNSSRGGARPASAASKYATSTAWKRWSRPDIWFGSLVMAHSPSVLQRCGVPKPHRPIGARRGENITVGTESHVQDRTRVSGKRKNFSTGRRIPNFHRSILARSGQAFVIRAENHARDGASVPLESAS